MRNDENEMRSRLECSKASKISYTNLDYFGLVPVGDTLEEAPLLMSFIRNMINGLRLYH